MKSSTIMLLAAAAGVWYLAKKKKAEEAAAAAATATAASPLTATAQETPVARPALAPSPEAEAVEAESSYEIFGSPVPGWGVPTIGWGGGGRRHRHHHHRGGGGGGGRGQRGG